MVLEMVSIVIKDWRRYEAHVGSSWLYSIDD